MQGAPKSVGSHVSQLLIGMLLCGSGCDVLWQSHLKNDPDNCVQDPSVCGAGRVCNQLTQICEAGITLTAVKPGIGPSTGGVLVTVQGSAFVEGMSLTFDGAAATQVSVLSPTSLQALLPARPGVRGKVAVALSAPPAQLVSSQELFSYYPGDLIFAPAVNSGTVSGPQTLAAADVQAN